MSTPITDEAAAVFTDPKSYADEPRLHAAPARMEVNSVFTELLPRLKSIELHGTPELISTTFVGGLKHLPIRCQVC